MSREHPISAPIVIVGTGRCGSTLLHRLMASHDDLAWLSTFNEVFPRLNRLAVFSNLYRAPLPRGLREARAFPKPYEAYRYWESYLPGFSRRDRPLTAADVDPARIDPVRRASGRIVRAQRRGRLLVKVTGWSRITFFDRIYPDALFVSLRRDPRSVVSSWIQAGWLDVSSSPDGSGWQWGDVPEPYLDAWRDLGGGPVLSAALKIRLDLQDVARSASQIDPQRVHELWYEDLIREPVVALTELCDFARIPYGGGLAESVSQMRFADTRGKWRRHLSEEQGESVLALLARIDAIDDSTPGLRSAETP